jgi:hypothetical protein
MTSTEDFGRRELVPLIDKFMAIHPGVVIALHLHDGVVDLVEHNLDLALRNGPLSDSTPKARVVLRGRRVIGASPAYWDAHGRPSHPTDLTKHNCLVVFRPSAPFGTWSFVVDGKPLAVRVSGNRIINDGGVLRHWAKAGYGVTTRVAWDIQRELERGELETVLDEFMPDNANLYAVTAGGISSRRVRTFIDYLVEEFLKLERPLGLEDLAQLKARIGPTLAAPICTLSPQAASPVSVRERPSISWRRIWSRTDLSGAALTTLLANPEKSCRHSSDYHRLDNARYPTCTRNDGRSRSLRSGLLTAVSVNRD